DECARVVHASQALFGRGALASLDEGTLAAALAEVPCTTTGREIPSVVDLLVATGLSPSRSAARRTIAEGGAYLNNRKVVDPEAVPEADDPLYGRFLVLRRGKRSIAAVVIG